MENQSPYYQFNFNKIFVIESLPIGEDRTGKRLYEDAIEKRIWQFEVLKSEYIYVSNKEELFSALELVEAQIASDLCLPYLHFEMHGSKSGLHLEQGVVSWSEVTNRFRSINIVTRNNLMMSFATCYGNEIHKCIDFSDRAPFFGFIAPTASVSIATVEVGFSTFFNKLFTGDGFEDAYDALNKLCIGEEYFVLNSCEDAFDRPFKKYIDSLQNPVTYAIEVLKRATEMLEYPNIRNVYSVTGIIQQAKVLVDESISHMTAEQDFFLMRDLPPHTIISKRVSDLLK